MGIEGTSVGSIFGKLTLDWSEFNKGLQAARTSMHDFGDAAKKVGQEITSVGMVMSKAFTVPLSIIAVAATKTFTDFELSMSRIEGLVGVSKNAVAGLAEEVKKLAPEVGKAPKELADALYYITSAGVPANKAMEVLTVSSKAAAAGLGTTQVVANAVTSAMNAYASSGLTAGHATDILTAAVRYGKLEADSLAPALGQVISVAATLGISFDQVAGSMAAMSRTGVDASQSATALTAIMSMLLKPTKAGTDLLTANGLSLKQLRDMAAQPGGLIEVLRTLDTTFQGDDEAMATLIPNIRALRGVLNLLTQDSSTVNEVLQGVTNSTGSTDRAFQAYADTAKAKLDTAMGTLKVTLVDLGQSVMPMVTAGANALSQALEHFTHWWVELSAGQQKVVITMAAIAAGLGPLLIAIGSFVTTLGAMSTALNISLGPIGWVVAALSALAVVIIGLIAHYGNLKAAMKLTDEASAHNIQAYKAQLDAFDAVTESGIALRKRDGASAQVLADYEAQRAKERVPLEKKVNDEIAAVRGNAYTDLAKKQKAANDAVLAAQKQVNAAKTAEEKSAAATALAEAKANADALVKVNQDVADKLYKITHTTVQNQIYDLNIERSGYIAAGANRAEVDKWYAAASKKIYDDAAAAKAKAEQDAADKATAAWEQANDEQVQNVKDTYDKYIQALGEYTGKQQDVQDTLTQAIIDAYGVQKTAAVKALEAERDATDKTLNAAIDKRNELLDTTLSAIDKERDAALGQFDTQISALQAQHEQEQRAETLANLRAALAQATTPEELARAQKALDKELADEAYQDKLNALRAQRDATAASFAAQVAQAREAAAKDIDALQQEVQANDKAYNDPATGKIATITAYYDNLMLLRNASAEAEKTLADKTQSEIMTMLQGRLGEWKQLGTQIGDSLYSGLQRAIGSLNALITAVIPTAPDTGHTSGSALHGMTMHASGGYFTTPHIATIAEKEPEWIVPQSKASAFASQMGGNSDNLLRELTFQVRQLQQAVMTSGAGVVSAIRG